MSFLAGVGGLEPTANGFGDRYSTNCATPLRRVLVYNTPYVFVNGNFKKCQKNTMRNIS